MNKIEEAKYRLLFYGMKYEWVREIIEKEDIHFELSHSCSKEEIEDYIKIIKSEKTNLAIDILKEKFKEETDPLKQAEILNAILQLNRKDNDE